MVRGSKAVVDLAKAEVVEKVRSGRNASDRSLLGSARFTAFMKLKASARNCRERFSPREKLRDRATSLVICLGPRKVLRPRLPAVPGVGVGKLPGAKRPFR